MFHSTLKKLALAGSLALTFTLVGCLQGEDTTASAAAPDFKLKVTTTVDGVNKTGLSKSNLISLNKLIIVMTSNATPPDTVRDTILAGSQGFSATATTQQTVNKNYTLKGLRTWTVNATVKDTKDSVVHTGSTVATAYQKVADSLAVSLSLNSRFTMYEAKFNSLPDSITSSTGPSKQKVNFKRLILFVDGVIRADSIHPTFFSAGNQSLFYDYVSAGSHAIRLVAMGTTGTTFNDTLYSGVTTIVSTAGVDSTVGLSLTWRGPNTGVEKLSVTIGKVGKTLVDGTFQSNPVPKK